MSLNKAPPLLSFHHNEGALLQAGINANVLDEERVQQLAVISRKQRMPLLDLVKFEWRLPLRVLYQLWAESLSLPFMALVEEKLDRKLTAQLSTAIVHRKLAVPIVSQQWGARIVCADPNDSSWRLLYEKKMPGAELALAEPEAIQRFLSHQFPQSKQPSTNSGLDPVALLENIFVECHLRRGSDIHVESLKYGVRVRLRVDGKLQSFGSMLNSQLGVGLISRIKVLAGMDIAESRAPQDGGFTYEYTQAPLDGVEVRAASLPGHRGERITLRILAAGAESLSLDQLGMPESQLLLFRRLIRQSHGMLLITGPTGSGKSTTLYSALRVINRDDINVLTVEDPVESDIEGITQVNVDSKTNFASALRSFLRHDPDVIMVGEIRDKDTADVALKAAMTGHFVFSTLHTNTACGAIARLGDIGCDGFLIGSTLRGIIAQQLVRRLCRYCRVEKAVSEMECELLGFDCDAMIFSPQGCARCQDSGYRGRVGLFECLWIDVELADFIGQDPSELELAAKAGDRLRSLQEDAREKMLVGWISFEDVEPLLGRC